MRTPDQKHLIITLSGKLYAIDLIEVAEVADPQTIWPVPGAPPCYAGAINLHGTNVAALKLAEFLGLPADSQPEKILFLNTAIASLALLVQQVIRIVPADQSVRTEDCQPFVRGMISIPEGDAQLLDVNALIQQATEALKHYGSSGKTF